MSGTSNFLQFNPTQATQETDAEYLADATRTSGALDGNAWPDVSANKVLYQVTTMTAALGQMLANKGFSVSDSNYAALVSQLANLLTTVDLRFGLQNLSWSSSIALNAQSFTAFAVPLQGSTTLSLTGVVAGQVYVLLYTQDSAGSHAVTFGSGFGSGAAQPDPGANILSVQVFLADAALVLRPAGPLMSRGGINNTSIGAAAPSSGVFTTLSLATGAPLGQVLTGDGSKFVPTILPFRVVAVWNGPSGTLVDSGNGGSAWESGAVSWGTTITGAYTILGTTTGWPSGSYIGDRCGWGVTATPIDGSTFKFAVNGAEISHARGSFLPSVTLVAVQNS